MNLQSKYILDGNGNKYAPITTPNAIRWPDGSNLNDKLGAFDTILVEAPVNSSDATAPITTLDCEFGRYYRIDVPIETLAINLPEITDNTTVRTFVIFLKWGTSPAITITSDNNEDIYYLEGYEELILMMISDDILELNFLWNGSSWIIAGIRILEPTV